MALRYLMRNLVLPAQCKVSGNIEPGKVFRVTNGVRLLERLSRLNVFIGPNNSGKSRLLRELFRDQQRQYTPAVESILEFDRCCDEWRAILDSIDLDSERYQGVKTQLQQFVIDMRDVHPPIRERDSHIDRKQDSGFELRWSNRPYQNAVTKLINDFSDASHPKNLIAYLHGADTEAKEYATVRSHCVYIPAIRSLRRIGEPHLIPDRILKDHFGPQAEFHTALEDPFKLDKAHIICGSEFYDGVREFLLGTRGQREAIQQFENYLAVKFFDGKTVTIVPRHGSDVLFLKVGNEEERPIHELGDGLSHLIIMTLPLFIHRDKALLLFIEEPELYLHPGYQRAFIDAVLDTDDGACRQVFVSTHSSQFLDITIDRELCTIYRVEKHLAGDDKDERHAYHEITVESSDNRPLLRELGVRNSSVLLSNCTIWVEGVTDRLYLRHYLGLHQKSLPEGEPRFLEDVHFSFVEYSGGNITHWSFLDADSGINVDRLCGRLMLIADKDGDKKSTRHS